MIIDKGSQPKEKGGEPMGDVNVLRHISSVVLCGQGSALLFFFKHRQRVELKFIVWKSSRNGLVCLYQQGKF